MSKKISGKGVPPELKDSWMDPIDTGQMGEGTYPSESVIFMHDAQQSGSAKKTYKGYNCYLTHPALKLPDGHMIYGGSCLEPAVDDADVYVALDSGFSPSRRSWPWAKTAEEVYFKITDMSVPQSPGDFKNLISWLIEQIKVGKKVHIGCIGGHGRTGMVLAAIYSVMSGEADAITYVRENYCHKAVETPGQVDFLAKHFGITKVKGSKDGTSSGKVNVYTDWSGGQGYLWKDGKYQGAASSLPTSMRSASPIKSPFCIWGEDCIDRT